MEPLTIRLTDRHKTELETLVEQGEYSHLSEAVRDAIRHLLDGYDDPDTPESTWGD